jgi:hypothetical protein
VKGNWLHISTQKQSVGQETVNVNLGSRANVNFAIRDRRHHKLHGVSGLIAIRRRLPAVPKLVPKVGRIVCM